MTTHRIINGNSNHMKDIEDQSVHLIVTSPPYPMIKMWDDLFSEQDPSIAEALLKDNALVAFDKMHMILNRTWEECDRVLIDNGFICINIGDATRTINDNFQLFSNHTAIINYFVSKGYSVLPDILWRKPSNAPNKFMGSGMYPAGAYVTYEHEYILIFRKGGKRTFKGKEKELRQESAYFWEERNLWFSDLWEIKGTSQAITHKKEASRKRNASFPFEIPFRLVNMYSVKNDVVLDPFCGLGITNLACMLSERNSIGIDIDYNMAHLALANLSSQTERLNKIAEERISAHVRFMEDMCEEKRKKCYPNTVHGFLVKTRQETAMRINKLKSIELNKNILTCKYE